jgi:thiamine biosynthesis lipoprotein
MGDSVSAWGFGPHQADPQVIRAALGTARRPTHQVLELDADALRLCKHAQVTLDLCGIAKGYGVDRLMAVLARFGIGDALVGIDGEMRANGLRPDGRPWAVAVERPDHDKRAPLAVLELTDCAVATSGDYRHWVDVGDRRLSHTMDPARGGPLSVSPASVTVLAETCMQADAWATALMVQGTRDGAASARRLNLNALFIDRAEDGFQQTPVGPLFDAWAGPAADT